MGSIDVVQLLAAAALIVAWLIQDVRQARCDVRLLPSDDTDGPASEVSVLVPARNEAARIGACLAGLAQQNAMPGEIIVVDDHSTDATVAVVNRFAPGLPGLRVLPSDTLPPGW